MKKQIADEILSLSGKLERLPEREALRIVQTVRRYTERKANRLERAWIYKGGHNNG